MIKNDFMFYQLIRVEDANENQPLITRASNVDETDSVIISL